MDITHFNQQGDVRLIVIRDEKRTGYVVNSIILRLASPVFAALLGPDFAAGNRLRRRAAGDGLMDMERLENDADALKLLFDIVHMRKVPGNVELDKLI